MDEYLATSFRPDQEYLDGELRPRAAAERIHGRVLSLLTGWFGGLEEQYRYLTFLAVRTRVSLTRVRLPDFVLAPPDSPFGPALTTPPLLAIDVLSAHDRYKDLRARAQDLTAMGAEAVWLLDPEEQKLFVWSGEF